ncbi:MAG: hypothetical protein A2831_01385 [Candidatus Yanofskybacteria bacterium RIFCSPHIGHO2_01_FULL_44_17]|uniref:Uncharacterized protein n=1 Tax=Candidatus Yanofskybacteria bacterium RIFCSPHIGHO2_01_FULL_44_17 TaxID=1802668 RepID=A0A1F8EX86_9BACT|nr:MAG: hypothetical protein A2831_01385 [Candidatus Yanofskybacteria bacterium RIFCSPHIGHO2_01_FULL_44_17]
MLEVTAASDVVRASLLTLWGNVAGFLPRLVAAIVVFLVGWIVAVLIAKLVWHIIRIIRLDRALEGVGFRKVWERSGYKLNSPLFFYELVKWFFVVVFLMAATDILGLAQVTEFLRTVVYYLPNVFVATFVVLIGVLVARFTEGLVRGWVKAAELVSANFLGSLTKWSILIFSFLIALSQLKVADEIVRIVVIGFVAAGALAIGLAFGLGGRAHADEVIAKMRKHIGE